MAVSARSRSLLILASLFLSFLALTSRRHDAGPLYNFAIIVAAISVVQIARRFAYAAAGERAGLDLLVVRLERGRFVVSDVVADAWRGTTILAPRSVDGARAKLLTARAVRLAVPSIVLVVALFVVPSAEGLVSLISNGYFGAGGVHLGADVQLACIAVVFTAIIPIGRRTGDDARAIGQLVRADGRELAEMMARPWAVRASMVMEKDPPQAREILDEGLKQFPDSWILQHDRAIIDLQTRDFASARERLVRLLDHDVPDARRAIVLNNVAWVDLRLKQPELLEEAAQYSAAAVEKSNEAPWAIGTRGMVLIELGSIDRGVELCTRAFRRNQTRRMRAINAACLAIASARRGDLPGAKGWLETARALDRTAEYLEEAEAAVQASGKVV
jgi:hypothetical protein